jgi:hypothetical protein
MVSFGQFLAEFCPDFRDEDHKTERRKRMRNPLGAKNLNGDNGEGEEMPFV